MKYWRIGDKTDFTPEMKKVFKNIFSFGVVAFVENIMMEKIGMVMYYTRSI